MSASSPVKQFFFISLLLISFGTRAQMAKKIDCCKDVSTKATIIINDNTSNAASANTAITANASFNFELTSSVNTSAGVYNADGNLIRTLWSGVHYDAGCYAGQWDGLLDDGVTQADYGKYTVKVLTNNVQYTWEGGIGDNSTAALSDNKLRGNDYTSFITVGNLAYAGVGYSEHETALKSFNLSDINLLNPPSGQTEVNLLNLATDGNLIYCGGDKNYDGGGYSSWVHAIHAGDVNLSQNPVNFAAKQSITANSGSGNLTDNYAISLGNKLITGLAVQKTGNLLFVARSEINEIQVIDKRESSGNLIKNNTVAGIFAVAADPANYLYATVNGVVKKYMVSGDGTLADTGVGFAGLTNASYLSYSNELNRLVVVDNSLHQIKIYNSSGGAAISTIGRSGGYEANSYYSFDRLADVNFVYYQSDGSLWYGQTPLHIITHLNADLTFKESSEHLPTSRAIMADQNNPARVFNQLTEYERDYSKQLDNGKNGSWKIKANWNNGHQEYNNYAGFLDVKTLSNGRTYGVYTDDHQLYELTSAGRRATGKYIYGQMGRDGTIYTHGNNNSNGSQPTGVYQQLLTGFDSGNNPVWSAPALFVTDPATSNYTPWFGYENTSGQTAGINKYTYFNNGTGVNLSPADTTGGYRLGTVKAGSNQPIWKTAKTTFYNYNGPYPADGGFDTGNNTGYFPQHSETHAMVYDNDVFWNVNGEFWQNTEANYWNHVEGTTGLLIGHFGTDGNLAKLIPGAPQMAGNAFSTAMVKVGNDYYLYHCDESVHAFIHSWRVSGLNTVNILTIPVKITKSVSLPVDPADLMVNVPFKSSGFYGGAGTGWTMNPAAYDAHSYGDKYPDWRVTTTVNSYRKDDNDIYIESDNNQNGKFNTVSRALPATNTNNWTFSGYFKVQRNINDKTKFDLLDANGKILITFYTGQDNNMYVNGSAYQPGAFNNRLASFKFIPFVLSGVNGQLKCSINGLPAVNLSNYESGANTLSPGSFRVRAGGSGDNNHTLVSIKSLFLY